MIQLIELTYSAQNFISPSLPKRVFFQAQDLNPITRKKSSPQLNIQNYKSEFECEMNKDSFPGFHGESSNLLFRDAWLLSIE